MTTARRREVRYNAALGEFELQCPDCRDNSKASYWPITIEFWLPRSLIRCRACWRELDALRRRRARLSAEARAKDARRTAEWRRRNPGYNVETARIWRQQHPERKREQDRRRAEIRRGVRLLSPEQEAAIVKAVVGGGRPRELAGAYGVHTRTIYRTLERAGVAA